MPNSIIDFNSKKISDPIYGTIGLSKIEVDIINTKAFQRLRNIKHLGFVHYVYPGADFSRFSHSIGCCHVMGLLLNQIKNQPKKIKPDIVDDRLIQRYRLAALLHDIGHYPFSHAFENGIKKGYEDPEISNRFISENGIRNNEGRNLADKFKYLKHYEISKLLVSDDQEILNILNAAGYEPKDIYSIFLSEVSENKISLSNLINSDLDADRMDYLLRTASSTSLPYGALDYQYLISQMRIDDKNQLCLDERALRAADHFLLSRYFAYYQISYHKSVVAIEELFQDIVKIMIQKKIIRCSMEDIKIMMNRVWYQFDDSYVINQIRECLNNFSDEEELKIKALSLLYRKMPKLVYEIEYIDENNSRDNKTPTRWSLMEKAIESLISAIMNGYKIPKEMIYKWRFKEQLISIGRDVPLRRFLNNKGKVEIDEEISRSIYILQKGEQVAKPLVNLENSIVSHISDKKIYSFRVYILFPEDINEDKLKRIKDFALSKMKSH